MARVIATGGAPKPSYASGFGESLYSMLNYLQEQKRIKEEKLRQEQIQAFQGKVTGLMQDQPAMAGRVPYGPGALVPPQPAKPGLSLKDAFMQANQGFEGDTGFGPKDIMAIFGGDPLVMSPGQVAVDKGSGKEIARAPDILSSFGKVARDEGLVPGTTAFNAAVKAARAAEQAGKENELQTALRLVPDADRSKVARAILDNKAGVGPANDPRLAKLAVKAGHKEDTEEYEKFIQDYMSAATGEQPWQAVLRTLPEGERAAYLAGLKEKATYIAKGGKAKKSGFIAEDGKSLIVSASNSVRQGAAAAFGGFWDLKTGQFIGMSKTAIQSALALAANAEQILLAGEADAIGIAIVMAAEEAGIEIPDFNPEFLTVKGSGTEVDPYGPLTSEQAAELPPGTYYYTRNNDVFVR